MTGDILFGFRRSFAESLESLGLAALRPVEHTLQCGSMLRMTSRERMTYTDDDGVNCIMQAIIVFLAQAP